MNTFYLKMTLRSDTLFGSGEGFGAIIDNDIVFDEVGIPYIPAKRIKGCLRDAADETFRMFREAKLTFPPQANGGTINDTEREAYYANLLANVFGRGGGTTGGAYFANLMIDEYDCNKAWLSYLSKQHKHILAKDAIMDAFTTIRQQTAIDEETGVAKDQSLRTVRVARKGMVFYGEIRVSFDEPYIQEILALACLNLRHIGTSRNRGFGEVECCLLDEHRESVSVLDKLEGLCTQ